MADDGGSSPLQISSIDTSEPGTLRVRIVSPIGSESGLDEESVTVVLDGTPVEAEVEPVDVQSLGVTLVVDTSQSMAGPAMEAAKAAAVDFASALPADSPMAVVGFGDVAELHSAPTADREATIAAIEALEPSGETSLYDGISVALGVDGGTDRRVLVVLSDGGDTASEASLPQAREELSRSGTEFIAIALATDESNTDVLDELARTSSGSSVVSTDDPAGLAAIYENLAAALSSEYEVAIEVGRGPWVDVELEVADAGAGPTFEWRERVVLPVAAEGSLTTAIEQPPPIVQRIEPVGGLFGGPWTLWASATMAVAALFAAGFALFGMRSDEPRSSLVRLGQSSNDAHIRTFRDLRSGASLVVEGVLVDSDTRADVAARMEQAGLRLRSGEFVIVSLLLLVTGAMVGTLLLNPPAGVILAVAGLVAPWMGLSILIRRRRKAFASQLPDLLSAMSNTLKVGYSLPQAINSVADETVEPAQGELKRALLEARVGRDLVESLRGVAERTSSTDLDWVVDAVEINATVGGDLVDVLERVAETIRSRTRMKAQINALTAEARMSALVLFLLPPGLGLAMLMLNPAYFEGIWDGIGGYAMLGLAAMLLGAGGMWLRRMISAVTP